MPTNMQDLFERHLTRPFSQRINQLRNRIADINERLDRPAMLDQYPGRAVPFAFTRLYGPLPLTTARRVTADLPGGTGFQLSATLADPSDFYLPRNGNVKVGRYGSFVWTNAAIFSYLSWTYSADPGLDVPPGPYATFPQVGDIFDSVIPNNGGALAFNNNVSIPFERYITNLDPPNILGLGNISFDIGLYDKLRGRFLHDTDRMPAQFFSGQNVVNRPLGQEIRFDDNTELEVRLYLNEFRLGAALDTNQAFDAAQVRGYVMFTMLGRLEQQEP